MNIHHISTAFFLVAAFTKLVSQTLVADINIGSGSALFSHQNLAVANGLLFFPATDSMGDHELYISTPKISRKLGLFLGR
jgi:hypothetical protein